MHAAAVEQFLKTILKLQKKKPDGPSVADIARLRKIQPELAEQAVQTLLEKGAIEKKSPDSVTLTPFGVRRLLTESTEDYLVTIYRLSRNQAAERVTTSAIAQAMGVSAPSVTSMTQKKLTNLGLVNYERHRGVMMTQLGERIALQILRHHRIVELYLAETLGLAWDQVHDEANRLEHAMSPMLIERMAAALGDPQVDPHGDPIPSRDGITTERSGLVPLNETPAGQIVVVRRVRDQSGEVLRYLSEIGLVPGAAVTVVDHAPLNGTCTVRINEQERVLGLELAHIILVASP